MRCIHNRKALHGLLTSAGAILLLGCPAAPPPDDSQSPTFTAYVNPTDPLMLSTVTNEGETLEIYGEKDADGLATKLTALKYQTPDQSGTEKATWVSLDDNGRPSKIVGEDGTAISLQWLSDSSVAINAVSADGSIQVITTADSADSTDLTAESGSPGPRATASQAVSRIGIPLQLEVKGAPTRQWATNAPAGLPPGSPQVYQQTKPPASAQSASNSGVTVQVLRCGQPVSGATVTVSFGPAYNSLVPAYTASPSPMSDGQYFTTVPTVAPSTAGQTAEDICKSVTAMLGHGCTALSAVEGHETYICGAIAAAIDAAAFGPTGEGVPIFAACEAGIAAFKVYCATVNYSAVPGAPSLASFICDHIKEVVDRGSSDPAASMQLWATARLPGLPPTPSATHIVSASGPFPTLTVDFGGWGPTIDSISVSPADPAPGQGYVASVRLACLPPDSYVSLSVAGSDNYSDSVSTTAEGDAELTLSVPGAAEGVGDLITVQVNLLTLKNVWVLF